MKIVLFKEKSHLNTQAGTKMNVVIKCSLSSIVVLFFIFFFSAYIWDKRKAYADISLKFDFNQKMVSEFFKFNYIF